VAAVQGPLRPRLCSSKAHRGFTPLHLSIEIMGIPSPLNAPSASPLLSQKLKQLSPEVPLLEAVEELADGSQAYDLLPPPSIALRPLESKTAPPWTDVNDVSDASGSSDERDDQCKSESTDVPRDNESFDSRSNSSVSKSTTESSLQSDIVVTPTCQTVDILQDKGVTKVAASALVPLSAVPEYAYAPAPPALTQMLCRLWYDELKCMSIIPCTGDEVLADCKHDLFWCIVQPQRDGSILITPCSDAATCGVTVDASGSSLESDGCAEVGAPARPPPDAYAPMWVYGPQWPYCSAPTTLVLSGLPEDLTQDDVIEILDKEGFNGYYDFIYLPMNSDLAGNCGYVVVNMTRHEYGLALAALMQGKSSWCGMNSPQCQVTWSFSVQGRKQLAEQYRDTLVKKDSVPADMLPTFFSNGWPAPFPSLDEL